MDKLTPYLQNPKIYQNTSQSHESKIKNDNMIEPKPWAAIATVELRVHKWQSTINHNKPDCIIILTHKLSNITIFEDNAIKKLLILLAQTTNIADITSSEI